MNEVAVGFLMQGIVTIVGGYGSGKTEIAINLALFMKEKGLDVRVADLDIVNLYFRTREARDLFSNNHIHCILPEKAYLYADFPALNPEIGGLFRNPDGLTILDCGGDQAGATLLSTFKNSIKEDTLQMLLVVNPFRPDTGTEAGVLAVNTAIEKGSGLKITGIIGNANLLDETHLDTILSGYEFVSRFSEKEGLPVVFITAPDHLVQAVIKKRVSCPVLPITRRLLPPWKI